MQIEWGEGACLCTLTLLLLTSALLRVLDQLHGGDKLTNENH